MPLLRLGTRATNLARTQAELAEACLKKQGHDIEVSYIKTQGDKTQKPLHLVGGKGLFVKDIEQALLEGKIDVAVHALKDMPFDEHPDLIIAAVMPRNSPHDVFIHPHHTPLEKLKVGVSLGTSSLRRQYQLQHLYPHVSVVQIRGSIETRLAKMEKGHVDTLLLAAAGLERLRLTDQITHTFTIDKMVPAAGQGILALQCRAHDNATRSILNAINHRPTFRIAHFERAFLKELQGNCDTPVGGCVSQSDGHTLFYGFLADPCGARSVWIKETFSLSDTPEHKAQQWVTMLQERQQRVSRA